LIIPLSEQITFDENKFMEKYLDMWKEYIVCGKIEKDSSDTSNEISFGMGDRNQENILWITYSPDKMQKELTDIVIKSAEAGFTDNEQLETEEQISLQNNKSTLELNYMLGKSDAKSRINFTARALLTLSEMYPVIGYINASAQSYRPKAKLSSFVNKHPLESVDLFLLFINVQVISENISTEIHTHGMDQFQLPDIQMIFENNSQISYNFDVLRNGAVYLIDNDNILKIGHTAELAGDGINYEVVKGKEEKDHPFGTYGVIGLRKQ
jgi:hypothetical protein